MFEAGTQKKFEANLKDKFYHADENLEVWFKRLFH